ncbi:uncharacterized protein VP01_3766g1 [Puccinia sorghi]|uniref:Uncharacterized protein n=1 Tax=Puccinia sorghi TaxID=27349 RepID=A0A0L6UTQ6_9BASI|nr:uncharacterized protein VP01_3766g1 [Puccinia sorghi]
MAATNLRIRCSPIHTTHTTSNLYSSFQGSAHALQSSLAPRNPSQILARPLTPLLTLAAYGSLIFTAFSVLVGLLLASYGLSAWDDAKDKLVGVRGIIGKGIEVGKDFVGAVTPTAFQHSFESNDRRTAAPSRAQPEWTYPSTHGAPHHSSTPPPSGSDGPNTYPTAATGYQVPIEEDWTDGRRGESSHHPEWFHRSKQTDSPPSSPGSHTPPQTRLPPRPPISVLIASLVLTLIVLTARLLVVWWMGQQAQRNSTHAFKNAQRAYEEATNEENHSTHLHPHHSHPTPSSPSSSPPRTHLPNRPPSPLASSFSYPIPP